MNFISQFSLKKLFRKYLQNSGFWGRGGWSQLNQWAVKPTFISSTLVTCNSEKQHIILVCVLANILVVLLGLGHEH